MVHLIFAGCFTGRILDLSSGFSDKALRFFLKALGAKLGKTTGLHVNERPCVAEGAALLLDAT